MLELQKLLYVVARGSGVDPAFAHGGPASLSGTYLLRPDLVISFVGSLPFILGKLFLFLVLWLCINPWGFRLPVHVGSGVPVYLFAGPTIWVLCWWVGISFSMAMGFFSCLGYYVGT